MPFYYAIFQITKKWLYIGAQLYYSIQFKGHVVNKSFAMYTKCVLHDKNF